MSWFSNTFPVTPLALGLEPSSLITSTIVKVSNIRESLVTDEERRSLEEFHRALNNRDLHVAVPVNAATDPQPPAHSDTEIEYYEDSSAASSPISELEGLVLAVDDLAFEISQLRQYVALTRERIRSCSNLLLGIRSSIQRIVQNSRTPSPDEATSNLDSNSTTSSQVERDLEEEENVFGFTSNDWMFSEYRNPKPSIEPETPPRQTLPLPPTRPPPPPIPPKPSSMSNPTQLHGKVTLAAEPFEFRGEKEQFIAWRQALQLYLTAYASYFPDEKTKLIYLLSKISDQGTSTVKAWKENVLTKALDATTPGNYPHMANSLDRPN
ncbi:hypothetical protein SERLADRAFT_439577 [Serpula lacrymans var. lacrymans S7.9]|uniref:Retrotransposon gag domain-containing protein n=1 Tax=Serpula lacrymans var. lacrymans (strain S7.9) TaxID=578457 RepID=F8P0Y0_SERL9|nr:uncharacterized protein SERLADRAFT_439577 [Serpula lacrymans var. lacrymans S7.9]EGO22813.1 hypothetical protein SERLADRAFT_439577 [Serpula lacrymans var. lacrymans S7.9]